MPLLQTKLHIPHLHPDARRVSRPRLIERLNQGVQRKLTLVCAPAGFGKTSLVSEWIHGRGTDACPRERGTAVIPPAGAKTADGASVPLRVAWLSIDESDNDPARFVVYLIAALRTALQATVESDFGQGALSALHAPQPPPMEAILTVLINELSALPDRMILVLDDYHLLDSVKADNAGPASAPIHDALTFLLRHLPPAAGPLGGLHLVIVTREDPPLPLARLRARGQLTELRALDLRFLPTEIAELFNQVMGLGLSAEDLAALERRTEGWIAGLHLAGLALQGSLAAQGTEKKRLEHRASAVAGFVKSFTGSHRFVLDYLVEEVLEQQPEEVQAFLLQTSILGRLTGSLCDALQFGVSEQSGDAKLPGPRSSQAILEELERANLFVVPLDEERRWYRYHRLFADLLQRRLRASQPEQVLTLHRRASEWFEANGLVDEAIEHALRAEDYERVAWIVYEHADAIWQRGGQARLRRWLSELPAELVLSNPHLCIIRAWDGLLSGQFDAVEQSLRAAQGAATEGAAEPGGTELAPVERAHLTDADRKRFQGRAAVLHAFLASFRGDVSETISYVRQALAVLPEQDVSWRSTATVALGDAYSMIGDQPSAYQVRREAWEASKAAGNAYWTTLAATQLAATTRKLGRLEAVIELCREHWELARASGLSRMVVSGWLLATWGEALAELNDLDQALERAKTGLERAQRGRYVGMTGWSYLCLTRVLYSRGELDGAQAIMDRMARITPQSEGLPFTSKRVAGWQVKIWLASGRQAAASEWVRERGLDADDALTHQNAPDYLALARILIAQGRQEQALPLLQRLFEATEPGGNRSRTLEILLLQALAFQAQGDTDQALATLHQALTLAEPSGFFRAFVDEGPPMARLLYEAATRGIAAGYAGKLLAASPALDASPAAPSKTAVQPATIAKISKSDIPAQPAVGTPILEPLSERELEVLQLIAEGLTNPEIAARLYLSLNTVKAHTRNIYGKLDAHSRVQAVGRARVLGILPST